MLEYTKFVYCPRCGRTDIEPYRKNAMRCTECGYSYFHNTAAAVGGIIETGGGILLTVRAHEPDNGLYGLPGGFVEYDESLEDSLTREVREEVGIDVTVTGYLCSFPNRYVFKRVDYFTCDAFFVCRPTDSAQTIAGNHEIERWVVAPADRIPFDRFAFPSHVKALQLYCKRRA